jgi:phosphoglycerate kinase
VFSHGTLAMAQALGDSRGQTVVSGDDTVAALHQAGVAERLTHVSTAGAAGLAVIEGQDLPGVTVLRTAVASEPSANEKRSAG